MKYYHTAALENKESILEHGINAMVTDKITCSSEQITKEGVFLFVDFDSAVEFGEDNHYDFVIFAFDTDEDVLIDPEYEGEAVFLERAIESNEIVVEYINS